jgi:proteic killer suppression protein
VIRSFKHRGLRLLYEREDPSGIRPDLLRKVIWVLTALDSMSLRELNLPGFHLHPLKGNRAGFWAVTVRANWRIVFRPVGGNVYDVELIDYH